MFQSILRYTKAWLNVDYDPIHKLTGFQRLTATFWITLCYAPFLLNLWIMISVIKEQKGIENWQIFWWPIMTVPLLMICMFFHSLFEYNIYPTWAKFAKFISLPLALAFKPFGFLMEMTVKLFASIAYIFANLVPLLFSLAIVGFIIFGTIGLLVFGIRQLF